MKTKGTKFFLAPLLAVAILTLGVSSIHASKKRGCCASKTAAFSTYKKSSSQCASKIECKRAYKKKAQAIKALSTPLRYHETKRLVLSGEYVCGKCSLSKLDFCQGFLKTSDGKLYPLLRGPRSRRMMKAVHGEKKAIFEIVAHVKLVQGVKYLEVAKFKKI